MPKTSRKIENFESSFKTLIDHMPEGCMLLDFDWRYLYVNDASARHGRQKREDLLGHSMLELYPGVENSEVFARYKRCMEERIPQHFEDSYTFPDGTTSWFLISAEPAEEGIFVLTIEITDRKANEQRLGHIKQLYAALSQCNQAIVHCSSEDELFERICNAAVRFGGMMMAWVGLVDKDTSEIKPVASFGQGTDYLKGIQVSVDEGSPFGRGPTGTSARENRPIWCQDFMNDPSTAPWHERGKSFGWRSSAALPLLKNGTPIGSLTIYSGTLNAFDEEAQELLSEMVSDINFALDQFVKNSKLKEAEENLQKREKELKEAQRIGRIGNWDWDIATDKITWSDQYYKIIGYDPSLSPPGYEEHLKIYTPESAERLDAAVKKNMKDGQPYELDLEIAKPKTSCRWIMARSETKKDEQGNIVGLRGTAQDITERKQYEQDLRESGEKFAAAFHGSPSLIAITRLSDGTILDVNESFTEMLGYSEQEAIGKTTKELSIWADIADRAFFINSLETTGHISNFDTNLRRKDGTTISVIDSARVIKLNNEDCVLSIIYDISERKKAEQKIKELNRIRSKFIEIISHQLRTPLTAVNWNLEILLNGEMGKLEEGQSKFLQLTHLASLEITRRMHILLTAMDIEEGRVSYNNDEVSLSSVCTRVVADLSKKCEVKNVVCHYSHPENESLTIQGDGEKIRMVIYSLIENAVMYTKEGGEIKVVLRPIEDGVRLEVADTGIGIPLEEQGQIFGRFFRASNASVMEPDAFGLSLYISKNFIEQHKGKVGFESKEGEGSIFWVEVPR